MTDRLQGEVIGFRQWTVTDSLRLGSASSVFGEWAPGENVARCHPIDGTRGCRKVPSRKHECGLYALHAPTFWYGADRNRHGFGGFAFSFGPPPAYVAGLVSAWGRVEVHHAGFRAERARVAAIAIPVGDGRKRDAVLARAVAAEYGVPCVPQDELERVAAEFGSTIPEELRPEKRDPFADLFRLGTTHQIRSASAASAHWQSSFPSGWPWTVEDAESESAGPIDRLRERKARTKYDPSEFMPKRKGGRR